MKLPTPPPDDLENLIALCLELYEGRGASAVDQVLAERPDSADLVRERLDLLGRLGLVGEAPEAAVPAHIGDYRIIGVLGRGGMGVVYEAEQERPRRRVALKVLRSWGGEKGRHRFQHETELLARLQHPGIAAIYEVDTAVVGGLTVPFFAMELVVGRPLDLFAREAALDVRARAALVAKIADAVHHAHQKGVVHRDLKPANVIVDERGEPRVLDFGIARALDPDLKLETLRTEVGQLVGTLAYMSPEQTAGEPDRIDSQTDVYSLGVVAFELLGGCLPHEVEGRSVLEVLQTIRDDEPPRLGALDRGLRGDLETIVAKALAKEKERRYSSAHELASDLRRYLRNEPITARPATAAYQLAKLARRHRVVVGGAGAVVLALVLGLVGTLYGLVQARQEREEAEARVRVANAVLNFQADMFKTADPRQEGVQVRDLLERAALMIDEGGRPPVETAAIRLMMGGALAGIGAYDEAEPLLVEATACFERELGASDIQSLAARTRLGDLYAATGRYEEAHEVLDQSLETAVAAHGSAHDSALWARVARATLLQYEGRYEEAVGQCAEVERLASRGSLQWLRAKAGRAGSHSQLGEYEDAAEHGREALDWCRTLYGDTHSLTLAAMEVLGGALQMGAAVEEGGELIERVLEIRREVLGDEHPDTLLAMVNTAYRYQVRGDHDRADELLREAAGTASRVLTPAHPVTRLARGNLANSLLDRGANAEAEELLWQQLDIETEVAGPEHPSTLALMSNLAIAIQSQNRFDEAEELFLAALEINRETVGDRHVDTLSVLYNVGDLYMRTRRYDRAEAVLREAAQTGAEVLDELDYRRASFLATWALSLSRVGRLDEADEALREATSLADQLVDGHPVREKVRVIRERLGRMRADQDG